MASVNDQQVRTPEVITDLITVNGHGVNGIAVDKLPNDSTKLVVASLLTKLLDELHQQVNAIDPNHTVFKDKSVITEPTLSPIFEEAELWKMNGFYLYDYRLIYNGDSELPGDVRLPNKGFSESGHYLIRINIAELNDGIVSFIDGNDKVYQHFTKPGNYYQEIQVTNTASDAFYFKITERNIDTRVVIDFIGIHFIKDRFYQYLTDKIQAIADINGGGYLSIEQYDIRMNLYDQLVQNALDEIIKGINVHLSARNPHHIDCGIIHAAPVDHAHTYADVGAASADHGHDLTKLGAAAIGHAHDGLYLTGDQINNLIHLALESRAAQVGLVAPMTILDAPMGILPDAFMDENIHPQVQLLVPSLLFHDSTSCFDLQAGMVSKSGMSNDTLPYLFSLLTDQYAVFDDTEPTVSLHYQFHTKRLVTGYKVFFDKDKGRPVDWDVYMDFDDYIHHGTISSELKEDHFEFTFMESVTCQSLTWCITNVDLGLDKTQWALRIQPVFGDVLPDTVGIVADTFVVAIPDSGAVKTITVDNSNGALRVYPNKHLENLPLFIYLDIANNEPVMGCTYFPPEIGTVRHGLILLWDYSKLFKYDAERNVYKHPFLGTYRSVPMDGSVQNLEMLYELTDDTKPVSVAPGIKFLDLEHIFDEPVMLTEYRLHWLKDHLKQMPESWSLSATVDMGTHTSNIIVDSVASYNKTMTTDGDVVYHKRFNKAYKILSMSLHLRTTREDGICLSQFIPFIGKDFYSIPKNTMYALNQAVPRIYIGKAWYHSSILHDPSNHGYAIENQYLGKTCTVPVNDLEVTENMKTYRVNNPYYSKEINCTLRPAVGTEGLHTTPIASVTSITEEGIYITTYSPTRFVVDISRRW